ncbi:MAG: LPS export ABC transporter periplasmic protein LptC, partial [Terriglobales bacterium]
MPLNIPRLRRWLAAAAAALICLVAASYFYARYKVRNSLKQIPEKIGVEIQQSAKGFTISKSFQGHTLFKIEASKAVQFKEGGRGELHDVEITVYGRDSERFDRITGKDFEYDSLTGDITGKGKVEIDLEDNPGGLGRADQTVPNDLKNPIHLETRDLVFNQKAGDAHVDGEVDFAIPQGIGSAVGLNYVAARTTLTLNSQVRATVNGLAPISITADQLTLSRTPRTLVLEHPQVTESLERSEADRATVYLSQQNKLERVLAQGNVIIASNRPDGGTITAGQLNLIATAGSMVQATLLENVHYESTRQGGIQGAAGRVVVHFDPQNRAKNEIKDVHADGGVRLIQISNAKKNKQSFELTAPGMDFLLVRGKLIRSAKTSGPPQITVTSLGNDRMPNKTIITAAEFEASFDDRGRLAGAHGGPDSRIVSKS